MLNQLTPTFGTTTDQITGKEEQPPFKVPFLPVMLQVHLLQLYAASEEQHELVAFHLALALVLQGRWWRVEEVVPPTQRLPILRVLLPIHPTLTTSFSLAL